MRIYKKLFDNIIEPENLFLAWDKFRQGKRYKPDVQEFERNLEQNIFELHRDLRDKKYRHGSYEGFFITDPKRRHIHKAKVRDRILHHAIFQILNPIFETTFISNSFSCRVGKGTHNGVNTLRTMLRSESRNNTRVCYVLKCDVRKFFDSINHTILLSILEKRVQDPGTMELLRNIIGSYQSERSDVFYKRGVPIGNLTSQLFANVYMNEFDQFIKQTLKIRHYARYTDDFIIIGKDRTYLESLVVPINNFLNENLGLDLHPDKVSINSYVRGVDFLGYVVFPHHTLVRSKTKKRILRKFGEKVERYNRRKIGKDKVLAALQSYLGVLSHANAHNFSLDLKNYFWFRKN